MLRNKRNTERDTSSSDLLGSHPQITVMIDPIPNELSPRDEWLQRIAQWGIESRALSSSDIWTSRSSEISTVPQLDAASGNSNSTSRNSQDSNGVTLDPVATTAAGLAKQDIWQSSEYRSLFLGKKNDRRKGTVTVTGWLNVNNGVRK